MASSENIVALYMAVAEKEPAEEEANIAELSRRIQARQLKLLDFVRILGQYLTDEDPNIRKHALGCLSGILASFPPKILNIQEVDVMTAFYCDRLEDETSTKENIAGLTALQEMSGFGEEEVNKVCNALFKDVDMSKHLQATRMAVFTLIDRMVAKQRKFLKRLGKSFIEGFVSLMANEKDPHNLMLAFSTMKVILIEFDIVGLQEKLFDAVFCYFPITFKARPDDVYGITADDLKLRLRECIAATHYFAPDCIPQLLDKMNSSAPVVKIDTLQTLTACARNYGPQTISTYAVSIWDTIRFEILNGNDEDVSARAIELVKAITQTLSFGLIEATANTPLANFLKVIVETCSKELKDPSTKVARPAGLVLSTCSSIGPAANKYLVEKTVPSLIMLFKSTQSTNNRTAILDILNGFLGATASVFFSDGNSNPDKVALWALRDGLFEIYSKGFLGSSSEEVTYKLTALDGFRKLFSMKGFLATNEIGIIVQYFDDVVLRLEVEEPCRKVLEALAEIAKIKPQLILDITFPAFLAELPDSETVERRDASMKVRKGYKEILAALARVSSERAIFDVLLRRLFNKLDIILSTTSTIMYPHAIIGTIYLVLQEKSLRSDVDLPSYMETLLPTLLNKIIVPATIDGPRTRILCSREIIHVVSLIVNTIVRAGDVTSQAAFYRELFKLFVSCEVSALISSNQDIVAANFRPLAPDADDEQAGTVEVFVAAVAGARKETPLPIADVNHLLLQAAEMVCSSRDDPRRLCLLKMIACVVNKERNDNQMTTFVKSVVNDHWTSKHDHDRRKENLELLAWLAKSLTLRTHALAYELIQVMLDLLRDEKWGKDAGRAFQTITSDDELISKSNHAVIRLLYKQRFFNFVFPKLVQNARAIEDGGLLSNYLIALSYIIANIPKELLLPELSSLLPLLLRSLSLPSPTLRANAINTVYIMVMESPEIMSENLEAIISVLLAQIPPLPANPPPVRIASLRCLAILPAQLSFSAVEPFKKMVIRKVGEVLDDPKRNVRKEAVDCRHAWYSSSGKTS